ncbi:MAG: hypothetical protein JNJ99_07945, partial [Crocinitomicaceae bacterium]|nr:hypothetical protein [Crocinitomicaceae bacterium]
MKNENEDGNNQLNPATEHRQRLTQIHPEKLLFRGRNHAFEIVGHLPHDLADMTVMAVLADEQNARKIRKKINLFSQEHVLAWCAELGELLFIDPSTIENDLFLLADLLEKYRDDFYNQHHVVPIQTSRISPSVRKTAIGILKDNELFSVLDKLLFQAGIAGEEKNRLPLFLIALTYKFSSNLHALVMGSSGSGKSHLMNTIAACFPQEDVVSFTRFSSKALFHQNGKLFDKKLVLIQDYEGLEGSAKYALRELQSENKITQQVTVKNRFTGLQSQFKNISTQFSSIVATTRQDIYKDNLNRSIIFQMDESIEQTRKIIDFQKTSSANTDKFKTESYARQLLQAIVTAIQSKNVVNPFVAEIAFPADVSDYRRMHDRFLKLIELIAIVNQFKNNCSAEKLINVQKSDLIDCVNLFSDILFDSPKMNQPGLSE